MRRKACGLDYSDETGTSSVPRPRPPQSARRVLDELSAPIGYPTSLPSRDLGALHGQFENTGAARCDDPRLKLERAYKRSWSLAFAPARSLLTTAFALFMTGSSVHLFSIMTCVTVLFMQLQALSNTRAQFTGLVQELPELRSKVLLQLCVHFALCAVGVAGALWQCHRLGFLPTTESDYTALLPPVNVKSGPQFAGGFRI